MDIKLVLSKIILVFITIILASCSAVIIATAPNLESLVPIGSTKQDLEKTLGVPVKIELLSEPVELEKLHLDIWNLLVKGKWEVDENEQHHYRVPVILITEKAYYHYTGKIQNTHDVGELVSINLMTFGLLEPLLANAAWKARTADEQHLFTVWFDASGNAIAYQRVMIDSTKKTKESE